MSTAGQLGAQGIGIGAAVVWSAIGTYLVVKFLEASVGARVSLEEERNGRTCPTLRLLAGRVRQAILMKAEPSQSTTPVA